MPATATEADRLVEARPGAAVTLHPDGSAVVHVPAVVLPAGWTAPTTSVWWVLSPGYPSAQPDCFFADADLRLASGGLPANAAQRPLNGDPRLWFSWHLTSWRPGRDDLLAYLRFIERRLADAR